MTDDQVGDGRPFILHRRQWCLAVELVDFIFQLPGESGQQPVGFQPTDAAPTVLRRADGGPFKCRCSRRNLYRVSAPRRQGVFTF